MIQILIELSGPLPSHRSVAVSLPEYLSKWNNDCKPWQHKLKEVAFNIELRGCMGVATLYLAGFQAFDDPVSGSWHG